MIAASSFGLLPGLTQPAAIANALVRGLGLTAPNAIGVTAVRPSLHAAVGALGSRQLLTYLRPLDTFATTRRRCPKRAMTRSSEAGRHGEQGA